MRIMRFQYFYAAPYAVALPSVDFSLGPGAFLFLVPEVVVAAAGAGRLGSGG